MILLGGEVDAVEAVRKGAAAYFPHLDPEGLRKSIDAINELVEVRRETAELEKELFDKYTFAGVVGRNPRMIEIFNFLRRIAPYYKTVTITGETGVGKEEVAKALHSVSPNSGEPFIACNCGGLLENLLESEFFGYRKGAFTGAMTDKAGIFEAAGSGVVFLDEIGDLPLSFQPHLLRVLQNGDFRRLGSTTPLKARCRVIAATNRDLSMEVRDGRFREDLFFRLTPLTISVPPLRGRRDDIPLLVRYLLDRFRIRTGKKILGVSRTAQAGLISYDWPGNVRELENIVERALIVNKEEEPLSFDNLLSRRETKETIVRPLGNESLLMEDAMARHIKYVLDLTKGKVHGKGGAAEVLGINPSTLRARMRNLGISFGRGRGRSL